MRECDILTCGMEDMLIIKNRVRSCSLHLMRAIKNKPMHIREEATQLKKRHA
jgi:hypothetical protein